MCIVGGGQGNCMKLDETNLLSIMEDKYSINDHHQSVSELSIIRKYDLNDRPPSQVDHDYADKPNFNSSLQGFSLFKETAISYIAGFIGKVLSQKILCYDCNEALGSKRHPSPNFLYDLKDCGPLFKLSISLIKVCKETETKFQRMLNSTDGKIPKGEQTYLLCNGFYRKVFILISKSL